jgi:hypothetical protein
LSDCPELIAAQFVHPDGSFFAAGRRTGMILDPKHKPQQDDGDREKRERQEEELDEALKNTFPASDPVSIEQP